MHRSHYTREGWVALRLIPYLFVLLLYLAGCAPPAPSSTATSSPNAPPLPSVTSSTTPPPTRQPRPPANRTTPPTPPKIRPIQLNQPLDAIYTPGKVRELYAFTSDRVRWVGIELVARDTLGDLRLVAQVYDAAGTLIPKVIAPIGQPSLRDVWDLPGPGTYTIRIFGTETDARAFDLRVSSVPIPEIGGGSVACNETRSGEIVMRGQRDQWIFEGKATGRVTISMLAPGKDGILEFYDPIGDLIAHSDDAPHFSTDPALEITLPVDGSYSIVARMYDDAQAGTYRLVLTCGE